MITLQNEGLLEIDLMSVMGVNVKETENAIGHFGTGLKYAISVFLREAIPFKLYLGLNEYKFDLTKKEYRGKEFNICTLQSPFDFRELGFTDELGKGWELWQAYRELHSNCLDENGEIHKEKVEPKEGCTTFQIDIKPEDMIGVFLDTTQPPIHIAKGVEVYDGPSDWVYYRGIRAHQLPTKSLKTYNLLEPIELTEDRTVKHAFEIHYRVRDCLGQLGGEQAKFAAQVLGCDGSPDVWESTLKLAAYHCGEYMADLIRKKEREKEERIARQNVRDCAPEIPANISKAKDYIESRLDYRYDNNWSFNIEYDIDEEDRTLLITFPEFEET